MNCKSCGAELREGAKFCVKCGQPVERSMVPAVSSDARLSRICPVCQAQLREGAKFCSKCGAKAGSEPLGTKNPEEIIQLENKKRRSGKARMTALISVLLPAAVLVFAVLYFWSVKDTFSHPKKENRKWEPQIEKSADEDEISTDIEMYEEAESLEPQETLTESLERAASAAQTESEQTYAPETAAEEIYEPDSSTEEAENMDHGRVGADDSLIPVSKSYTALYVKEDSDGFVQITPDLVKKYIPESTTCYFDETHELGNELEEYIKASYSFADLVGGGINNGISGEGSRQKTDRKVCLLVFQWKEKRPYLIGYFAGNMEPTEDGNGMWCLKISSCNYDLTPLYEQERAEYEKEREVWLASEGIFGNYIPPEEASERGAAYFIKGYNTGRSDNILEDQIQTYHIWYSYQSPYRREIAKKMEQYKHHAGLVREGRCQAFLLLDENYEAIGYTVIQG